MVPGMLKSIVVPIMVGAFNDAFGGGVVLSLKSVVSTTVISVTREFPPYEPLSGGPMLYQHWLPCTSQLPSSHSSYFFYHLP